MVLLMYIYLVRHYVLERSYFGSYLPHQLNNHHVHSVSESLNTYFISCCHPAVRVLEVNLLAGGDDQGRRVLSAV